MTRNKQPKGVRLGGRAKGTPNKTTTAVKDALHQAFEKIGGVPALWKWGQLPDNRGEFYKLWIKTLPQEIKAEHTGPDGKPIPLCIVETIVDTPSSAADGEHPIA